MSRLASFPILEVLVLDEEWFGALGSDAVTGRAGCIIRFRRLTRRPVPPRYSNLRRVCSSAWSVTGSNRVRHTVIVTLSTAR